MKYYCEKCCQWTASHLELPHQQHLACACGWNLILPPGLSPVASFCWIENGHGTIVKLWPRKDSNPEGTA